MNRQQLKEGYDQYFDGFNQCYYITLDDGIGSGNESHFEFKVRSLDQKVGVIVRWLREKLVGQSRADDVRAFAFFEQGAATGVIHAHVVVAMKGQTDRTLEWVKGFVNRKWEKLRLQKKERTSKVVYTDKQQKVRRWFDIARASQMFAWEIDQTCNSDVRGIHNIKGCFGYSAKDFVRNINQHQFGAYNLY